MQKDDLESLVKKIYENLLEQIDLEKDVTKEKVINYLQESINLVSQFNNSNAHETIYHNALFSNEYKEIANESISSYKATNNKIQEIAKTGKENIEEYSNNQIDLEAITKSFTDIQMHMTDEVKKANKTISNLRNKVKTLEETSTIDALTKVFNRRALNSYLKDLCDIKHKRYYPHILMIDIDDFKKINDAYGHIAGDKVLILLSKVFKKALRDGDKIFRYGGEEFIIILNRISNKECMLISNRILSLIRANNIIYKSNSIHVTVSMGITQLSSKDTPESLISRADKALYKAKNNGKNQLQMEMK